jgi:tetratricopeptide (TPR) repeat protein
LICDASSAYGTLGDELGQSGTASLADSADALKAFRKSVELHDRALVIDPGYLRAKRGLSADHIKIGSVEMATDPGQALKDFQIALQRIDTLPKAEQSNLVTMRMRLTVVRKEANASVALGKYSEANALFAEIIPSHRRFVAADPQDLRALADLEVVLDDESRGFEAAADPDLAATSGSRRGNLAAEEDVLAQQMAILKQMLKQDPSNENWRVLDADVQIRLATVQTILHTAGDSAAQAKAGVAALRDLAKKDQASPMTLDQAAEDLLKVEPTSLGDPQFAVSCAERAVALSRRQRPTMLLTLAQAYRATGQTEKSRATAREALALLPAPQPGSVKPNIRKLLEIQEKTAR